MRYEPSIASLYYGKNRTYDNHGGMAEEHQYEMAIIARAEATRIAKEIYDEKIQEFFNALQYTIDVSANIALDTGENIYHREEVKKLLVGTIMKEMKSKLGKPFKVNL